MEKITQPKAASMFINVAYGPKEGEVLRIARAELIEAGIAHSVVPGPLIMRTVGKKDTEEEEGEEKDSVWVPMPMLLSSSYAALHRATDLAYARLLESGSGMPISLGGDRSVPHFAHNTWRRMADTAAQQCHANGGCSEEDIDLHMGWQLKKHARKMRLHYANRGQRAARALITAMI